MLVKAFISTLSAAVKCLGDGQLSRTAHMFVLIDKFSTFDSLITNLVGEESTEIKELNVIKAIGSINVGSNLHRRIRNKRQFIMQQWQSNKQVHSTGTKLFKWREIQKKMIINSVKGNVQRLSHHYLIRLFCYRYYSDSNNKNMFIVDTQTWVMTVCWKRTTKHFDGIKSETKRFLVRHRTTKRCTKGIFLQQQCLPVSLSIYVLSMSAACCQVYWH